MYFVLVVVSAVFGRPGNVTDFTVNEERDVTSISVKSGDDIRLKCSISFDAAAGISPMVHFKKYFDQYYFTMTNNDEIDDDILHQELGHRYLVSRVADESSPGHDVYLMTIKSTSCVCT